MSELDLGFNNISDISKIACLTKLEVLNLEANNITSMDDIKGLDKLKDLRMNYNYISTVPELSCVGLTYLDLRSNKLTDISKISKLTKLEKLYLGNYVYSGVKSVRYNEINDISALEKLSCITDISITSQKLMMIGKAGSEVRLPNIFVQAQDINSIGYTENELILKNCKLNDDRTKVILNTDSSSFATVKISGGILSDSILTINTEQKTLTEIKVTTKPNKTNYIAGQNFETAGMVVMASYSDGSSKEVTNYTVTNGNNLTAGKTSVTISYTEENVTKTTVQNITVSEKLSIEIRGLEETEKEGKTYIKSINPGATVKSLLEKINTNGIVEILKGTEKIINENTKLATGMTLKISLNNQQIERTIVVTGDLNGDGEMGDIDVLRLARYRAGLDQNLTGAYLQAANIFKDDNYADDIDLLKMVRILVGLDSLTK